MKNLQSIIFIIIACLLGTTSCVKKKFDEPPYSGDVDPDLPVTTSIKELKTRYDVEDFYRKPVGIGDDIIIYGIVTANDLSGNFYKQIMIQDSSGGIAVNINRSSLSGDFPVGRKVYVKCQGLSLGDYGKFMQIGFGTTADGYLGSIPTTLIDQYVVKASFPHIVEPKIVTVEGTDSVQGNIDLVGMLVKYERLQFDSKDLGNTYAESPNEGSGTNRTLQSCSRKPMLLRTSNYSNFQPVPLPTGSGEITAIYSRFNSDAQLLVRGTEDVKFTEPRCPFGTQDDILIRIEDLRKMYNGSPVVLNNLKIRGTVISDGNDDFGSNITSRNLVFQDGGSGIMIRFVASTENDFELNDSLEILLGGHTLDENSGWLQVGEEVKAIDVQKIGNGNVTPRIATIANIVDSFDRWESTLIQIQNVSFVSGVNTYYQNKISLNDNTTANDFIMFTQSYAAFAKVPAPIGEVKTVTGFLYSTSTEERISIRRLTDVQ